MTHHVKWKTGDVVEVRSKEEILATLDTSGRLDGLPFMPQMFQYCGRRFEVIARAHKTCDVVGGENRSLADGIHLDIRCDGQAYGGCQAGCRLFWKQAWLKPASPIAIGIESSSNAIKLEAPAIAVCTESDVWRATCTRDPEPSKTIYFCQATQVPNFTTPLAWWDIRQYIEDYTSGNISTGRMVRGFLYQSYHHGTQAWRAKIGLPARWLYDLFQRLVGGIPFPRKPGTLPAGIGAPVVELNLQPGEWVRIKSHEEILATVTTSGMNRGLLFDKEMVPHCGKIFRVRARVTTFVNEKTGQLATLKTPAVILEGVWCQSRYSNRKMFCPRALYSWWREAWLERVADGAVGAEADVTQRHACSSVPEAELPFVMRGECSDALHVRRGREQERAG
jgi:hypothetical protein